jgi:predicted nucleic acid-binding protein
VAGGVAVSGVAHYVIDTGYILERFKIPGKSTSSRLGAVKLRFEEALERKDRLYAPFPVIFEVANHIAQVKDEKKRISLAHSLQRTVSASIKDSSPWIIPTLSDNSLLLQLEQLESYCRDFAASFAKQEIGLTDIAVLYEAKRIKKKYRSFEVMVHIWTLDERLKRQEPDSEPDPFTG